VSLQTLNELIRESSGGGSGGGAGTNNNIKRIGNHAIFLDKMLGKGHYGRVYLGYDITSSETDNLLS
jgi:hypothetical protein